MGTFRDITKIFSKEQTPAQSTAKIVSDNVSDNASGGPVDIIKKKKRVTSVNLAKDMGDSGTSQKTLLGV